MTVQELLSSKEKWTQGDTARTKEGYATGVSRADAVSWCLTGAVLKCYPTKSEQLEAEKKLQRAIYRISGVHSSVTSSVDKQNELVIIEFNDDPFRTFEEIQEVVKLAGV